MNTYKDLDVWKLGCDLVLEIYRLTSKFPSNEQFGLTSQIRRAAVSIPSNIAEGFARRTLADNHNFVRLAFASGAELETQLYLAKKLQLTNSDEFNSVDEVLNRIMRMLNKLGQSLTSGQERGTRNN